MNTRKDFLSGEEVCKIIETCAKNKVYSLKCGPLELSFSPAKELSAPGPTIPASNPEKIIQEQQEEQKKAIEEEELDTREDQIADLLLTDPAKAEELMEQGELEPADEEPDAN